MNNELHNDITIRLMHGSIEYEAVVLENDKGSSMGYWRNDIVGRIPRGMERVIAWGGLHVASDEVRRSTGQSLFTDTNKSNE